MKPKGLVNKRITKSCPECNKQSPTACKSCSCGFIFFKRSTPSANVSSPPLDNLTRRRTGRVKKEPNYFNTMEYEHQFKRRKRCTSGSEEVVKKKKGKPKGALNKPKEEKPVPVLDTSAQASSSCDTPQQKEEKEKEKVKEEDLHASLTSEKTLQYSIILAELNRKFFGQTFSPS